MNYSLIISPWTNEFISVVSRARRELFISSPYVNTGGTRMLAEVIKEKARVRLTLLTSLTAQTVYDQVTEPHALRELYSAFGDVKISSLERLHAKVYIVDSTVGVITSANLTLGGLRSNFEYGVKITDEDTVSTIRHDMLRYYSLGNVLDSQILQRIEGKAQELHYLKVHTERTTRETALAQRIREKRAEIQLELLRNSLPSEHETTSCSYSRVASRYLR